MIRLEVQAGKSGGVTSNMVTAPIISAEALSGSSNRSQATPRLLLSVVMGGVRMASTAPASTSAPTDASALPTSPAGSAAGGAPPLQTKPNGWLMQALLAAVQSGSSMAWQVCSLAIGSVSCACSGANTAMAVMKSRQISRILGARMEFLLCEMVALDCTRFCVRVVSLTT
jgi:hypothetical protein